MRVVTLLGNSVCALLSSDLVNYTVLVPPPPQHFRLKWVFLHTGDHKRGDEETVVNKASHPPRQWHGYLLRCQPGLLDKIISWCVCRPNIWD